MLKDKELNTLRLANEEKSSKIRNNEQEILRLKKELLEMEKTIAGLKEERQSFDIKMNREESKNEYLKFQNGILEKQTSTLAEAVAKNESTVNKLLHEKKEIINQKASEFVKSNLDFHDIKIVDYFNQAVNWNYDVKNLKILYFLILYFFILTSKFYNVI